MSVINNKSTEQKSSGSSKHQLYCLTVEKQLEANETWKKMVIFIFLLILKSLHNDMPHLKHGYTLSFYCYVHTNTISGWYFNVLISHSSQSHNLFNCIKLPPLKREEALVSRILTTAEKLENQNIIKPQISFPFSQSSSGSQLTNFVNQHKYHFHMCNNSIQWKVELEING